MTNQTDQITIQQVGDQWVVRANYGFCQLGKDYAMLSSWAIRLSRDLKWSIKMLPVHKAPKVDPKVDQEIIWKD